MNNDTKDRIKDEEEAYFDRRLEELTVPGHVYSRAHIFAKINRELDDIRARRNDD